nr:lyase family protein [uncultured Cohaesibacter sp.]
MSYLDLENTTSQEMLHILSDTYMIKTYRRIWIALAEAEQEVGLNISDEQIAQMREKCSEIDLDLIDELQKGNGNLTIAAIEEFGRVAPLAEPIIHLGATTNDLIDNGNLIWMREATRLLISKMLKVVANLRDFVEQYKDMPILGYTRLQAAQPVTVGKRAAVWLQDAMFDVIALQEQIDTMYFRGLKGATGTQASFFALLDGDMEKVEKLDTLFSQKLGFEKLMPITSQIFTRKVESKLMSALAGIAETAQKVGNDIRVLAMLKELEEPVPAGQIGSSTMAYKRNPWIAEDLVSYGKFLITLLPAIFQATGQEMLEQTCDNLAVRTLSIANIFKAADTCCEKLITMTSGIMVYDKIIKRNLEHELPFMAIENIIMEAAKKGADRQEMHHILKEISMETVRRVRVEGLDNNILDRVVESEAIPLDRADIERIVVPEKFTGMAVRQVERFLKEEVDPFLLRNGVPSC